MELERIIEEGARKLLSDDLVAAESLYRQALEREDIPPDVFTAVVHNAALSMEMQQRYEEAFEAYAANVNSSCAPLQTRARSMIGMANTLRHRGSAHRAMETLEEVARMLPQHAQTHFLLSAGYVRRNDIEAACKALCVGLASVHETAARETSHYSQCYYEPMSASVYYSKSGCATNLDLLYCECFRETDILEFHKAPLPPLPLSHQLTIQPQPLKRNQPQLVYISEHFHKGSVMSNVLPILENHSVPFAIINLGTARDATTDRVCQLASLVIDLSESANNSGEALPCFPVAVCCDGHTGSKKALRLLQQHQTTTQALAQVVVDCVGYPFSTGLPFVQYKLVDGLTDPPGAEAAYTEHLLRMDPCFLTWSPLFADDPERRVSQYRPGKENRVLAPNNFKKIGRTCVELYKSLLKSDASIHLYFKSASHDAGSTKAYFHNTFPEFTDRVKVLDAPDSTEDHYDLTATFDLVVDAYPYNGTITTLEALWCGVPVVTVAGNTHRSRVGNSILSSIGKSDLVVHFNDKDRIASIDKFCVTSAQVLQHKSVEVHMETLRRLQLSPIMQHAEYTARFEKFLQRNH